LQLLGPPLGEIATLYLLHVPARLSIDDDPLVLEALASMLEELGCETLTARSANEALGHLAKDRSIEIMVADIKMPGLSGTELAERARSFRPELKILPVRPRD
jgi:CheY-like chemotaxis protein